MILESATTATWPASPYKGFAYYTSEDLLLFTGREDDVDSCVAFLSESRTRTLLLHGRTGCGKSSFLRAGLVPSLEERGFGYVFLRRDPLGPPTIIRSTSDPMARIAEEIFRFTQQPFRVQTAIDTRDIDLTAARLGHTTVGGFVDACRNPDILMSVLRIISEKSLRTIVIILDQAEEALPQGERQSAFFNFLIQFNSVLPTGIEPVFQP